MLKEIGAMKWLERKLKWKKKQLVNTKPWPLGVALHKPVVSEDMSKYYIISMSYKRLISDRFRFWAVRYNFDLIVRQYWNREILAFFEIFVKFFKNEITTLNFGLVLRDLLFVL